MASQETDPSPELQQIREILLGPQWEASAQQVVQMEQEIKALRQEISQLNTQVTSQKTVLTKALAGLVETMQQLHDELQ